MIKKADVCYNFFIADFPKHPIKFISQNYAYIVLTPLNPTFILQNWSFKGYTLIFLFLLKNIDCGYLLEPPH